MTGIASLELTPLARRAMVLALAMALLTLTAASIARPAPDPYVSLRRYQGTWKVTPDGSSKTDRLVDECARIGRFFACQQTVNGRPGALVIFIPYAPDRYHTQIVEGGGAAAGSPGVLTISGNHWVYLSKPDGKGIRYRTTNDFQGPDRIRFETASSSDGKRWAVTLSGIEERVR